MTEIEILIAFLTLKPFETPKCTNAWKQQKTHHLLTCYKDIGSDTWHQRTKSTPLFGMSRFQVLPWTHVTIEWQGTTTCQRVDHQHCYLSIFTFIGHHDIKRSNILLNSYYTKIYAFGKRVVEDSWVLFWL